MSPLLMPYLLQKQTILCICSPIGNYCIANQILHISFHQTKSHVGFIRKVQVALSFKESVQAVVLLFAPVMGRQRE